MTIPTAAAPLVPGARNATLEDLAALLRDQQARKVDIVAPAAAIRADGARLVVRRHRAGPRPGRRDHDRRCLRADRCV